MSTLLSVNYRSHLRETLDPVYIEIVKVMGGSERSRDLVAEQLKRLEQLLLETVTKIRSAVEALESNVFSPPPSPPPLTSAKTKWQSTRPKLGAEPDSTT